MKNRANLFLSFILIMVFNYGCNDKDENIRPSRTTDFITIDVSDTNYEELYINANYMLVEWGDGNSTEKFSSEKEGVSLKHNYSRKGKYTITIKANKVTYLNVGDLKSNSDERILNLGRCNDLWLLSCYNVTKIENIDCSQLSSVSISSFKFLAENINDFKEVKDLSVHVENLKALDLSDFKNLASLNCAYSNLAELKVPDNLVRLYCYGNEFKSLDVSNCHNLSLLHCSNNMLESLVFEKQRVLTNVDCSFNNLNKEALDAVFSLLPIKLEREGLIRFIGNPGTNTSNTLLFIKKGWVEVEK